MPPPQFTNFFEIGTFSQQVTIETICEDILLNIFRQFLDATPQFWPTLVWVCQRWRQIVFTTPLGLNIRLYCTYRTPVLKALGHWPALPIVMEYGFEPPAPEDDDNIIAALRQSDRVSSINLIVTSSLLEKISAISEPFTQLEDVVFFSKDNLQLTLPSSFHLGPRLRTLHLIKIAFPSLLQLLLHSQNLVDIQLHKMPIAGYFSPEAFANALSGMTQLRSLSLHFLSLPPRRHYLSLPPPPEERVVLPALTSLKYQGTSKYLDSFVGRIDAPRLEDIEIILFSQPTMDASQLGRFIERTEMHTSLVQADVETSAHAISISFTDSSASTPLRIQISCKQLDWQLSCMAQVCDGFSPFLSPVNNLGISTAQRPGGRNDANAEQWSELVRSFRFGSAKSFWVAGEFTTDILCAFGPFKGGHTTILPALRHLRVGDPLPMYGPSWEAVRSLIASRWLSSRPVQLNAPSYLCHICRGTFEQPQSLKHHLMLGYGYQALCSYCGDFEWTPERGDLFREHLKSEHPEVARKDVHISKPSLTPVQIDSLVNRHSSLRAPVPSSPTSTVPHFPINSDSDI
jgi:hypothetical protein